MPINILMPALSPTMEKGNLAKWLKKEGDTVKSGDVIAEIETDKATMEVEAVDEGTLAKIVVPEGTADVPVNQVIAVLAGEGEDVKAAAAGAGRARPRRSRRPRSRQAASACSRAESRAPKAAPAAAPAAASRSRAAAAVDRRRPRLLIAARASGWPRKPASTSPAIQGSGPHGRIIARDVEAREVRQGAEGRRRRRLRAAAAPSAAPSMSDQQIRALFEDGSYEVVPHDGMRRTIAQRLTAVDADRSRIST